MRLALAVVVFYLAGGPVRPWGLGLAAAPFRPGASLPQRNGFRRALPAWPSTAMLTGVCVSSQALQCSA